MFDVQKLAAELEPGIRRAMTNGNIPSATVAMVYGDKVIWTWVDGKSNIWAQTRADPMTVYLIGSTFKPMSALALLSLIEEGKCSLDEPVQGYLDFDLHGDDPGNPVTFRHLLTHTSGVSVIWARFRSGAGPRRCRSVNSFERHWKLKYRR